MTLHSALIVVQTVAALAAFVVGCLVLRPAPNATQGELTLRVHQAALIVMAASLGAAVAVAWGNRTGAARATFAGLTVLALVTVWRAWHAGRVRATRSTGWTSMYVHDVGFTLITLFEGFVIVGAIDLGAPVWVVVALAVLGVATGRMVVDRVDRLASPR